MSVSPRPISRSLRRELLTAALLVLATTQAVPAFVASGRVGAIDYRVMAPDWICRGEVVSLLIVVSASDGAAAEQRLVASLTPPESGFDAASGTPRERQVVLAPGQLERFSFTGWKARVDADRGRLDFTLRLESAGETPVESVELRIPVETIRGAAVPEGIWSIVVPIAISLLALPLFALLIRRTSLPGAWKRPVDLEIEPPEEPWWTSTK